MLKNPLADAGIMGSILGSGRFPGGGNGNLLQYSCLGNPMDRGAWQAIVHGVAKSPRLMRRFWNPVSYHLVHSLAIFQNQADISPLSLSVLPLSFFVLVEFITPESLYCHGSKVLRRREDKRVNSTRHFKPEVL